MTSKCNETVVCYASREELMREKFCPEEKMNQRLFKRLILYYNVGNAGLCILRQNIHKSRQRSIRSSDDSWPAVCRTTRRASPNKAKPSAAFPFGVGDRAFGP